MSSYSSSSSPSSFSVIATSVASSSTGTSGGFPIRGSYTDSGNAAPVLVGSNSDNAEFNGEATPNENSDSSTDNELAGTSSGITGAVIGALGGPAMIGVIVFLLVVLVGSGIVYYRRRK